MPGSDALALHSRSPASKESVSHGAFPNARRCVCQLQRPNQTATRLLFSHPAFKIPSAQSTIQTGKRLHSSWFPSPHRDPPPLSPPTSDPRPIQKPTSNPLQTYQTHRSTRLHLPSPTLIPNHLHQITIPGTMPPPSPSPSLSLSLSHHSLLTSHASLFLPSHSLAAMQSASHPTRRVTAWCTQRVCRPR